MLCSGRVVPFGQVAFGPELYAAVVELFVDCTLMAVKLCMPILAAELLGQMGMGILMKVIPQINIFVINIDLKVIIGLMLELLLIAPFSEYLLKVEFDMLQALQGLLQIIGTS
jgi:flagellar biosynthetic protein FliR